MQPSVLAFMGDAVYDLFIRERLIMNRKGTSHNLHIYATEYVKASSQAYISKILHDIFTEEEAYFFRRGRNAKSTTVPKHADIQDYKYATAFEAVLGYLYLTHQHERLKYLMEQAALIIESQEGSIHNEKEKQDTQK
ncbi:MAG: Mini-ribonuclease 3 [Clostridiaceae bacterium]|nr:Mini-ribonuclease 3 [Clostridiaceae bacterium]